MARGSFRPEDAYNPVEEIEQSLGSDFRRFAMVNDCTPNRISIEQVGCEVCNSAWEFLVETVRSHFPHLLRQFVVALSVCGVLGIRRPWKPLAVIFEGLSGPGKTLALSCIDSVASEEAKKWLYRSDSFSAASFVSQAASVSRKDLEKVDLLPRIRHKVLITPEMGPMFRGKKDELEGMFAILARVMDGRGLTTDRGTHGRRGHTGEYPFCWLGATTYLPKTAYDAMSNVGNRLFFVDTSPPRPTFEELAALARKGGSGESESECTEACNLLLDHFLSEHTQTPGSKDFGLLEKPLPSDSIACYIVVAARAISRLRCKTRGREEYEFRIVEQLSLLAAGRAVIEGSREISPGHLEVIKHVTFSAAMVELRPILSALLDYPAGYRMPVSEVEKVCLCAKQTALNRMKQLDGTDVCKYSEGKAPNIQSGIELAAPFATLATGSHS